MLESTARIASRSLRSRRFNTAGALRRGLVSRNVVINHSERNAFRPGSPSNPHLSVAVRGQYATEAAAADQPGPSRIPDIPPSDSYDIVIIGGGNAGLALACALLDKPSVRATSRILLLEGGSLDRVKSWTGDGPWENRISSLTAENIAWLDRIGVWKHIAEERTCPVNEMVIWSNPNPTSTPSIHFPPLGYPMARMTENTNLQRALLRRIDEVGAGIVDIRESSRVGDMCLGEGSRWVGLQIGDQWVRGSVVVGADGFNSPVRKFSSIESYGHAYPTHAVVATLEHPPSPSYPNNTAFQRFLPTGPIAFLPLSPTASTMVWSTHPTHAAAYKRLSPEALVEMVNAGYTMQEVPLTQLVRFVLDSDAAGKGTPPSAEVLREKIQQINISGGALTSEDVILPPMVHSIPSKSIASFPLRLSHADEYMGERTVLVGDAAHTTHPLAGQGLNMGLADVRVLSQVWEDVKRKGGDIGAKIDCMEYSKKRYPANQLLLTTTDTLHHVFSNRSGPLNWARGVGLDVINELGPLKRALMENAGALPPTTASQDHDGSGGAEGAPAFNQSPGWTKTAANGLEGWMGLKSAVGTAASILGGVAKDAVTRAAQASTRR